MILAQLILMQQLPPLVGGVVIPLSLLIENQSLFPSSSYLNLCKFPTAKDSFQTCKPRSASVGAIGGLSLSWKKTILQQEAKWCDIVCQSKKEIDIFCMHMPLKITAL
jgi:hypothetical protein